MITSPAREREREREREERERERGERERERGREKESKQAGKSDEQASKQAERGRGQSGSPQKLLACESHHSPSLSSVTLFSPWHDDLIVARTTFFPVFFCLLEHYCINPSFLFPLSTV
jgi:hypothetical protein